MCSLYSVHAAESEREQRGLKKLISSDETG